MSNFKSEIGKEKKIQLKKQKNNNISLQSKIFQNLYNKEQININMMFCKEKINSWDRNIVQTLSNDPWYKNLNLKTK